MNLEIVKLIEVIINDPRVLNQLNYEELESVLLLINDEV